MIESVKIKNFQSHKNTSLEFHKGVNVIVGDSDQGKTAILRALRFAIWNQPLGDRFRSRWGGDTIVEIATNGNTITRIKTDNQNEYVLNDEITFKALRTGVPDEIQSALNLSDINTQYQLDGHYLLSRTPGEVAAHFNKVAKLESIDISRKNIQSDLKKSVMEYDIKKKSLTDKIEELEKYKYLEKAEIELENIELLEKERNTLANSISFLKKTLTRVYEIKQEIRENKKYVLKEKQVDKILSLIQKRKEKTIEFNKLKAILEHWKSASQDINDSTEFVKLENQVNQILELYKLYKQKKADVSNLVQKLTNYTIKQKQIKETQGKLAELEELWHTNFPNVCPLCGNKIK